MYYRKMVKIIRCSFDIAPQKVRHLWYNCYFGVNTKTRRKLSGLQVRWPEWKIEQLKYNNNVSFFTQKKLAALKQKKIQITVFLLLNLVTFPHISVIFSRTNCKKHVTYSPKGSYLFTIGLTFYYIWLDNPQMVYFSRPQQECEVQINERVFT